MKRFDAVVQAVLAVAMVCAIVYGCQPAGGDTLLERQCEQHLRLCARCRGRGLTPARMLAQGTPTRCYSFGAIEGGDE